MDAMTEVRKSVRESPELGAYRVHAALEQIGIHLSQATCGRLLSLNRKTDCHSRKVVRLVSAVRCALRPILNTSTGL